MAYEYTSLSSFLQEKMDGIKSLFVRVDWLLGDDYMRSPVSPLQLYKEGEYYRSERTATPAAPLRLLFLGLRRVFSSYLNDDGRVNWEQVLRDLFQPFIGIGNVIRGVFGVIAGVIGFGLGSVVGAPVFLIISLGIAIVDRDLEVFSSGSSRPWPTLGGFLADTLGWIAEGLFQIVRGGTQIVGTPFTWFSMIPRAIATIATTPPKKDYSKGKEGEDYLVIKNEEGDEWYSSVRYYSKDEEEDEEEDYNSQNVRFSSVSAVPSTPNSRLQFSNLGSGGKLTAETFFSSSVGKRKAGEDDENSQDDNRGRRSPSPTRTPTDSDSE